MSRLIPLLLQPSSDSSRLKESVVPIVPPKSPKRAASLILLPYTQQEWRKVMDEVWTLYSKRHFKQCSFRCIQILDGTKNPNCAHPLYFIYLCFYAATCGEHTARSLHNDSSHKLPMFKQSLSYYEKAHSYLEYAAFSADPNIIFAISRSTRDSICSTSSSIRSSVESIFSNVSASSSVMSSPMTPTSTSDRLQHSRTSSDPDSLKPAPLRIKKVSFSPNLPRIISESEVGEDLPMTTPDLSSPVRQPRESSISNYLLSRSVEHYRKHLDAFSIQISYHVSAVTGEISDLQNVRKGRRSNLATLFTNYGEYSGLDGVNEEEVKKTERRARIERLKEKGWKRDKFDGKKYQMLCEKALEEVEPGR